MNETIESIVENVEVVAEETILTESEPTGTDVVADEAIDAVADVATDVVADEAIDAVADVAIDAVADVAIDAVADVATDVVVDVATDAVVDVATDAVADVTTDAVADVATEHIAPEADVPQADLSESTQKENDEAEDSQDQEDEAEDQDASNITKVVRTLTVGQEIKGIVKRITDFGAFVDIGVGRDGLVHISELSVRRVGKVADVLKEGQQINAWIKKLDRERNRINLTMISPDTKTIRDLEKDELVQGKVTRILPYGVFVDIGVERDALLHIREMSEGFINKPEDVVTVDDEIEAKIINIKRRRGRVDLSLKGLGPEPEPELELEPEPEPELEPEPARPVEQDRFSNVEVLSPMELAFKKAMEADGSTFKLDTSKRRKKRKRREKSSSVQDDIVTRTLDVDL